MEIEKTFLPIQWSETNLRLIRSFGNSLTSRPDQSNHKGLSIWQQKVIEQALNLLHLYYIFYDNLMCKQNPINI